MRGFLKKISDEGTNEVNAPRVMQRMGMNFETHRTSVAGDYNESLELVVLPEVSAEVSGTRGETPSDSLSVRGALLGTHRQARLVSLAGVSVELPLSGKFVLVIQNKDVPGIVGHVGNVLAAAKVNIANMSLGRTGDTALTLLELDSAPDEKTILKLRENKNVLSAKVVSL